MAQRTLRPRNTNIVPVNENASNPAKQAIGAPAKRSLKTESKNEPKAKRAALTDLSNAISNVLIDSTKKVSDGVQKTTHKTRGARRTNSASELTGDYKDVDADVLPEPVVEELQEVDPCPEYDFDAENKDDIYAVSEYARDIFKYYVSREKHFTVGDFLKHQQFITRENRAVIGDWLVEVQETFELNHETLYLAVKLFDMYMDKTKGKKKDDLQVIASTAVFIAAKFDERQPPLIDDFLFICEDSFEREQLIEMERDLLQVVGFDLGAPLSYRYLRRYSRVVKAPMDTLTLARYILETSLMFYELIGASDCLKAAGAFLLALRMKNPTSKWSPVLHKYSGLGEAIVEEAAKALNHMMWIRPRVFPKLNTVNTKYSHEVFFESALVSLLPDDLPEDAPLNFPQLTF